MVLAISDVPTHAVLLSSGRTVEGEQNRFYHTRTQTYFRSNPPSCKSLTSLPRQPDATVPVLRVIYGR
jgi:hypothetical protein